MLGHDVTQTNTLLCFSLQNDVTDNCSDQEEEAEDDDTYVVMVGLETQPAMSKSRCLSAADHKLCCVGLWTNTGAKLF